MIVNGDTQVFGIFGFPVRHTLSPLVQNAAFDSLGLNSIYVPLEVAPADLGQAVKGIKALGFAGINVTVPHKENVVRFLDEIDEDAKLIGAVNTIANRNGRLTGYNTDGLGYIRSLREDAGFEPAGKKVLVIGAGGAAMAIIAGLASNGAAEIIIANRTIEKAEKIKINYSERYKGKHITFKTAPLTYLKEPSIISSADLIVNTTSVGLGATSLPDIDFSYASPDILISDIVYKPAVTPFLKKAQDSGLRTLGGIGMLIYQGAISFEIWTSRKAPIEAMKKALSI